MAHGDHVDEVLADLAEVSGDEYSDDDIGQLVEVGAIEEVGARMARGMRGSRRGAMIRRLLMARAMQAGQPGAGLPSPPFGQSKRSTERRAPLGFVEDTTGANFFTLLAGPGTTTTMRGKVSRAAHTDRLLIVPSAPGVVLSSVKVGDDEQLLASGAPVELYGPAALTDSVPDNFSPLGPALDFVILLLNTTAVAITGTIGIKASVKR